MLVENKENRVKKEGVLKEIKYHIEDAGDVITQLVAGQYSDPIAAFLRELGTNAYEAHQEIGVETTPFHVTLPTERDNNFVIRDFGPGLSLEKVESLYTSVGGSSKRETNKFGGCFGLGSKSPFAYTDTFSVKSFHNGTVRSFVVYKDEDGYPHFDLFGEEKSSEPTGLEITVPIKRNDALTVGKKAKVIYENFIVPPMYRTGTKESYNKYITPKYVQSINNFHLLPVGTYSEPATPKIKMGNIIYPVDTKIMGCSSYNILIELNIGSVDVSTSRETLKYTKKTKACLELALSLAKKAFQKYLTEAVENQPDLWSASIFAHERINKYPFLSVSELKFQDKKLLNSSFYIEMPDVIKYSFEGGVLRESSKYSGYLNLSQKPFVFLLDDSKDYKQKIKTVLNNHCVVLVAKPSAVDGLKSKLGLSDGSIIKISSLSYTRPKSVRKKREDKGYEVMQWRGTASMLSLRWSNIASDRVDDSKEHIFVRLKNFTPDVKSDFIEAISFFTKQPIYGIRMSGKVPPKWIHIHDFCKRENVLETAKKAFIKSYSYARAYSNISAFIPVIKKLNGVNKMFSDVNNALTEMEKAFSKNDTTINMNYACGFSDHEEKTEIEKFTEEIVKKYPLISLCSRWATSQVINEISDYIKFKDKK